MQQADYCNILKREHGLNYKHSVNGDRLEADQYSEEPVWEEYWESFSSKHWDDWDEYQELPESDAVSLSELIERYRGY